MITDRNTRYKMRTNRNTRYEIEYENAMEIEYENVMEKQGFRKHKKRGAWIKDGLGMFLTNTSDFDENDNYLDIMKTHQFYQKSHHECIAKRYMTLRPYSVYEWP